MALSQTSTPTNKPLAQHSPQLSQRHFDSDHAVEIPAIEIPLAHAPPGSVWMEHPLKRSHDVGASGAGARPRVLRRRAT